MPSPRAVREELESSLEVLVKVMRALGENNRDEAREALKAISTYELLIFLGSVRAAVVSSFIVKLEVVRRPASEIEAAEARVVAENEAKDAYTD